MIKLNSYEVVIISLIASASIMYLVSATVNTLDNIQEEKFIATASCDSLKVYIDAGNEETDKVFASFQFSYNNQTGEYEQTKIGFDITEELVVKAEEKYGEFCP